MNKYICTICVFLLCFVWVSAQVFDKTKDPYTNDIPQIITVGSLPQIKKGNSAMLGLRLMGAGVSDQQWLDSLIQSSMIGFGTDSSIAVARSSVGTINEQWSAQPDIFAIDTNSAIAVNGLFSAGPIVTTETIHAKSLSMPTSTQEVSGSPDQVQVCVDPKGGTHSCVSQSKPIVSLYISPKTISATSPRSVQIRWSSSGADECHAVSGSGFFTNRQTTGEDTSNTLRGKKGTTIPFTLACTNTLGTITFQTVSVSVQ